MTARTSSCNCGQLSLRYEGPDPERVSLCQCYSCQKRSGSLLSVQTRLRRDHVTIDGKAKTFAFPQSGKPPVTYRPCDSSAATCHFCPECGSTLYGELSIAPDFFVVEVGGFTDPAFPPPIISGFEAEGAAWVMRIKDLQLPGGHHDYDGTSHGGPRL
jgi:hypothetical protein